MKQERRKIFNRNTVTWIIRIGLVLVLAALVAVSIIGYRGFTALHQKVEDIDTRLTEFMNPPAENTEYTEEEVGKISFAIASQQVRTVEYATTYDQTIQDYVYEPKEVLEVTLDVKNATTNLYDGTNTRIYASTKQGNLIADSAYSIKSDELNGDSALTLAPGGTGKMTLYFLVDGKEFDSIFIDDSSNFGLTYTIQL